jgi:hypothetical protein
MNLSAIIYLNLILLPIFFTFHTSSLGYILNVKEVKDKNNKEDYVEKQLS